MRPRCVGFIYEKKTIKKETCSLRALSSIYNNIVDVKNLGVFYVNFIVYRLNVIFIGNGLTINFHSRRF